jgi:P-type Cu+ transporter
MAKIAEQKKCYHCGESCGSAPVEFQEKSFCCDGCKMVFELLSENGMCTYYKLDEKAGLTIKTLAFKNKYAYLDDAQTIKKLLRFEDAEMAHVQFQLPQMHCSSCIWLLENLYKLKPGIVSSRVQFLRKEVNIEYQKSELTLRQVVELLASIGYEPSLHLEQLDKKTEASPNRKRIYRIAVAGFCFSNIMLLSFPEYFHIGQQADRSMIQLFNYLNLALSLPVLIYSGGEFFVSAWQGITTKFLNIDIPLALSIAITFGRSVYEIISETGAGYLDSMSGIIFFMLIGRYFQEKTYDRLQFDRNFKSYFPISVSVVDPTKAETTIPLSELKTGHRIRIRSQEIIPADALLVEGTGYIDYSFVTGESTPLKVEKGQTIYAGGRQTGSALELVVEKEVEQSYLTNLWNKDVFQEEKNQEAHSFIHRLARNFTLVLLSLSVGAFLFWLPVDSARGLNALTTVLIVACPCAILLSATFTHGTVLRIFSRNKFYLKNAFVIERLSKIKHIVFDKTGTLTQDDYSTLHFEAGELGEEELSAVHGLVAQSNHPLSKQLAQRLHMFEKSFVSHFREVAGSGLEGTVAGDRWTIGSASFVGQSQATSGKETRVYVQKNTTVLGYFSFQHHYRPHLKETLHRLSAQYSLSVLSGDNDSERGALETIFPKNSDLVFFQQPEDKLNAVTNYQQSGLHLAMLGDGLNDAGALRKSDVGIALSENVNNFSPACDAILEGSSFEQLPLLLRFARATRYIILGSFGISLLYNIVGVGLAVQGELAPVWAAILMPLSSISIVLFTTGASWMVSKSIGLSSKNLN